MSTPTSARMRPRRGTALWWVFALLLVVPILEVAVIISVGRVIGAWPTVALLIFESALGAWLVKREGRRAWGALRTALNTGRMPAGELADTALVLVGGTLLLSPGFVTDIFGFAAILPLTRPLMRAVLARVIAQRLVTVVGPGLVTTSVPGAGYRPSGATTGAGRGTGFPGAPQQGRRSDEDDIIEGEIL